MKKHISLALTGALILCLAACSTTGTVESDSKSAGPVSSNEPEEVSSDPCSPESIVPTVINNPVLTYQEDTAALTANNGAGIGTEEGCARHIEADSVVFEAGEGENPFMPLTKHLDDCDGVERGGNQAVYISFCPSQKDFGFMLQADENTSIGLTIGEGSEPCVFAISSNYMAPVNTNLRIEPGNWYGAILAIDADGNFQGALWKADAPEDIAYWGFALGAFENGDMYKNRSWELRVGFKGESTFRIARYCYYTFSGFAGETNVPDGIAQTPDLNADPMNVVQTVLDNPQILGGEDASSMTENMGGMFGGIDIKQPGEGGGYFQFKSKKNNAWMPYNSRLLDVGEHRGNTQALLIKFQPEQAANLSFNFIGMGEIAVSFAEENRPYFVNVQEASKYPFSDCMPTDLVLESDKWYYSLFAFDTDGNFRSLIWEDGNAEGQAYCEENLGEQRDDYRQSNWEAVIGFDAGGTLNIESYLIMDFNSYSRQ